MALAWNHKFLLQNQCFIRFFHFPSSKLHGQRHLTYQTNSEAVNQFKTNLFEFQHAETRLLNRQAGTIAERNNVQGVLTTFLRYKNVTE